jgi:hypothetical protein
MKNSSGGISRNRNERGNFFIPALANPLYGRGISFVYLENIFPREISG